VILSRFQLIYSKTATRAAVSRSFKLLGSYRLISTSLDDEQRRETTGNNTDLTTLTEIFENKSRGASNKGIACEGIACWSASPKVLENLMLPDLSNQGKSVERK
jgi:hypothetical protein